MPASISSTSTASNIYAGEPTIIGDDGDSGIDDDEDDSSWASGRLSSNFTSSSSSPQSVIVPPPRNYDYYNSAYYNSNNNNQGLSEPSHFSSSLSLLNDTTTTVTTTTAFFRDSDSFAAMLVGTNSTVVSATAIRQHLCSTEDGTWMPWERSVLLMCGLTGALLIAIMNICVIIAFIRCTEIRQSPQNLYILNLAICDFCVGINSLPGVTIYFFNMCWPFGVPLCQVMTNLDWISSTETGISMCLVAYDRLRLVRLGALYTQLENRTVVVRKIILSWVLVIGFLAPGFLMPLYTQTSVNLYGECMNEIYQHETLGTTMYTVTGTLPPLMLAVIYVMVHREMTSNVRFNSEREARRQRRAARGMYFLCAVFLASWIPPTVHELVMTLMNHTPALQPFRLPEPMEFRIMTFFKFWIYLNSLVNPFLYASAFPAIRAAMEKTFLPQQWHKRLDAKRRLRRSTVNNGPAAEGEKDSTGSMRKLRAYARSKAAPIGETLRLLYKAGSGRSAGATGTTTHHREQHTATTTAASTANNSFAQRSTRSATHRSPAMERSGSVRRALSNNVTGNGTMGNSLALPSKDAANPSVAVHSARIPLLPITADLLTNDPTTTTATSASTTSRTTTTTGSSVLSMASSNNVHNHIDSTDSIHRQNHKQLKSSNNNLLDPAMISANIEHIELVSMQSATNTTDTVHEELMSSSTPDVISPIDDDDDEDDEVHGGTLNMSSQRMLIVTPQGELLLRTVVVNGYTTVML